jgi:hypothetical protein
MKKQNYMYRLKVIAFLLLLPCLTEGQISKVISFGAAGVERKTFIKMGSDYEQVYMKMAFRSRNVGKPDLPVYYYKFYVSKDQAVTDVNFKSTGTNELQLTSDLMPVQHPKAISKIGIDTTFDAPDPIIYGMDAFYPIMQAKVLRSDFVDGDMQIVTVAFYPMQYNPKQRKIKLATDGTLSLTTVATNPASSNLFEGHVHGFAMTSLLKSLVENPDDVPIVKNITEAPAGKSSLKSAQIAWSVPFYEYVIVTSRALKPAFNQFVSWKKRKGFNAGVVCIEDIVADPAATGDPLSSTLTDNAGKLRQYLMAGYNNSNPKTQYTLLGGDYSVVPIRYGKGGSDAEWNDETGKIPSNLYFSDFNTNWTAVSTTMTGTDYSGFDYGPEIYVGRLLCSNETDIKNWTAKVLLYEQNPGNGNYSYLSKSLFTEADYIGNINTSNLPAIFTTRDVKSELAADNTDWPTYPKGADVISLLNSGYGFYTNFNHGGTMGFGTATHGVALCCDHDVHYGVTAVDDYDNHDEYNHMYTILLYIPNSGSQKQSQK